jgi:predicted Zn-dependent protease
MQSIRLVPVLCAALVACSVSDEEEVSLGRDYAQQINAKLPLVTDPRVAGYVSALGRQIASKTNRADLDWQFFVVDSRDVNAFALPGGFIYVNRGLIERAQRLDHLAGVLGHEIGHVVERHSVEQMKKATGANIGVTLLCTLTSVCESGVSQVVINVAGSALMAKYSRGDEVEADSQAVVNVINAGISPLGIPEFFRVLLSERQRNPNLLDNFFASHPLEERRVGHTKELIEAYDERTIATLTSDDPGYRAFKAIVAALPPPPNPRALQP